MSEGRTRDVRITRPTRYQLCYRRRGAKNKPAPGSDARAAARDTGRMKSRSQTAKQPGPRVDRQLRSSGYDAPQHAEVRQLDLCQARLSPAPRSLPPRARKASERDSSSPPSPSDARAVGCLVYWRDSRSGHERSRAQLPERPPWQWKRGASADGAQSVWPLSPTVGLSGRSGGGLGNLAGSDLGTGSGWQQSKQQRTPLRIDETKSPSATANLRAALAAPLRRSERPRAPAVLLRSRVRRARWPNGQGVGLWSGRAAPGMEPGTSPARSDNRTARSSSQLGIAGLVHCFRLRAIWLRRATLRATCDN